jgi:hypothetical protein
MQREKTFHDSMDIVHTQLRRGCTGRYDKEKKQTEENPALHHIP